MLPLFERRAEVDYSYRIAVGERIPLDEDVGAEIIDVYNDEAGVAHAALRVGCGGRIEIYAFSEIIRRISKFGRKRP